ncbi:MAG: sodium:solute symporter family protein [Halieaceae bacterium]|jgi:Na+/proline symporter|nr:sodium:solute symporter family protein [Halieaceae bacterium]
MDSFGLTMILSVMVYLGTGWYAGRKVRHLDDYFVAGRNAPTLLILGTLIASFMSTNGFIGEAGMSYRGHGPLIIIMTAVNCMGYILGALFFGRYLRRSQALTVPAFFGARFQSQRIQSLAGLSIVVGLSGYLLAVTWGVAMVVTQLTDLSEPIAIILVWASYTLFTLYSGSKGVILTDTLMFILFTSVAVVALSYLVNTNGGWFASIEALAIFEAKPDVIAWHGVVGSETSWETPGEALLWALILGVAWGVVVAVSPWQSSRCLMARNEHVVIRSACGAAITMLLLYLVTTFCAAIVNLSNPNIDPVESVIIWAAMNQVPTLVGALLVCGILAAGLSSASTFLSLVGFSVSNDILKLPKNDKIQLRVTRVTMLLVGLIVITLALALPSNIFWITYFAGPLFASSWGAVAFMSIWSSKITEAGAFWGMASGFTVNVVMNLLSLNNLVDWPVVFDPILVGASASFLTVVIVSKFGQVTPEEAGYRESLHEVPHEEYDDRQVRQTLIWPAAMILVGVSTIVMLFFFYARPYLQAQQAKTLGATSLISGETLLALSYGLPLIIGGILVWRAVKHFYVKTNNAAGS